jgi:uncharacterized membrane protein YcaP (DUF421 family)
MDIVLRAAAFFVFLFVITRVIGRRELNSLEPFDLILLVVTGDLVQQAITQSDYSVTGGMLVIATMTLLTVAVSFLTFRFPRTRPLLDGEPILLIHDGEVVRANAKRERITDEELQAVARQQQLASLDDVRYAVLETNGKISMIAKS